MRRVIHRDGARSGGAWSGGPLLDVPEEPRRRGIAWRLLLGCVIVVALAATTSAVFLSGQISTLRSALSQNPSLNVGSGLLANASFGGPQTLLLVGDDQRAHTTTTPVLPHSNEMLLVRIDPSKPWISMMSIPRELLVPIYPPNAPAVTTRFNYAYTAGGITLLVSTIKQVLGLPVNHVIVIDFNQFTKAVNEMGCVYSTVDRRYFHVNTPTSQQYQEINLQPGYQKLCGTQALQFVSYRHGDTSLVRDARDQSFLLDVKREYGPTLVDNVGTFEHIFGQTVHTDPGLHTTGGILDLLGTLISSSARSVRQVQFQATLLSTYDTATPQQISASVHSFLSGGGAAPRGRTAAVARAVRGRRAAAGLALASTSPAQLASARAVATQVPFPLEYPQVQDRSGAAQPVALRTYEIHAPGGVPYPAYVAVFASGQLGQYYDVQGTTWTTAPQFDNPDQTIHVGARAFYLDYAGAHVELVAWYEHDAVYWIRNTLLDSIGNGEMLAIAEQTAPVAGTGARHLRLALRAARLPPRAIAGSATGSLQNIGSIGGVVTLVALPVLSIVLLLRWRALRVVRARQRTSLQRRQQLTAAVTAMSGAGAGTVAAPIPPVAFAPSGTSVRGQPRGRRGPAMAGPTVPVAVLNATPAAGAAERLAQQLRAHRVAISGVGNLSEERPPGLWILYVPGARAQAGTLARLLQSQHPQLAPIDPVAQAAAGPKTQLVAVIA